MPVSPRPHPYRVGHLVYKDLAVTRFAGAGFTDNHVDHPVQVLVEHDNLYLTLGGM